MGATPCMCASEMCRRFGCQRDAELLREYQEQIRQRMEVPKARDLTEADIRRIIREELERFHGKE